MGVDLQTADCNSSAILSLLTTAGHVLVVDDDGSGTCADDDPSLFVLEVRLVHVQHLRLRQTGTQYTVARDGRVRKTTWRQAPYSTSVKNGCSLALVSLVFALHTQYYSTPLCVLYRSRLGSLAVLIYDVASMSRGEGLINTF